MSLAHRVHALVRKYGWLEESPISLETRVISGHFVASLLEHYDYENNHDLVVRLGSGSSSSNHAIHWEWIGPKMEAQGFRLDPDTKRLIASGDFDVAAHLLIELEEKLAASKFIRAHSVQSTATTQDGRNIELLDIDEDFLSSLRNSSTCMDYLVILLERCFSLDTSEAVSLLTVHPERIADLMDSSVVNGTNQVDEFFQVLRQTSEQLGALMHHEVSSIGFVFHSLSTSCLARQIHTIESSLKGVAYLVKFVLTDPVAMEEAWQWFRSYGGGFDIVLRVTMERPGVRSLQLLSFALVERFIKGHFRQFFREQSPTEVSVLADRIDTRVEMWQWIRDFLLCIRKSPTRKRILEEGIVYEWIGSLLKMTDFRSAEADQTAGYHSGALLLRIFPELFDEEDPMYKTVSGLSPVTRADVLLGELRKGACSGVKDTQKMCFTLFARLATEFASTKRETAALSVYDALVSSSRDTLHDPDLRGFSFRAIAKLLVSFDWMDADRFLGMVFSLHLFSITAIDVDVLSSLSKKTGLHVENRASLIEFFLSVSTSDSLPASVRHMARTSAVYLVDVNIPLDEPATIKALDGGVRALLSSYLDNLSRGRSTRHTDEILSSLHCLADLGLASVNETLSPILTSVFQRIPKPESSLCWLAQKLKISTSAPNDQNACEPFGLGHDFRMEHPISDSSRPSRTSIAQIVLASNSPRSISSQNVASARKSKIDSETKLISVEEVPSKKRNTKLNQPGTSISTLENGPSSVRAAARADSRAPPDAHATKEAYNAELMSNAYPSTSVPSSSLIPKAGGIHFRGHRMESPTRLESSTRPPLAPSFGPSNEPLSSIPSAQQSPPKPRSETSVQDHARRRMRERELAAIARIAEERKRKQLHREHEDRLKQEREERIRRRLEEKRKRDFEAMKVKKLQENEHGNSHESFESNDVVSNHASSSSQAFESRVSSNPESSVSAREKRRKKKKKDRQRSSEHSISASSATTDAESIGVSSSIRAARSILSSIFSSALDIDLFPPSSVSSPRGRVESSSSSSESLSSADEKSEDDFSNSPHSPSRRNTHSRKKSTSTVIVPGVANAAHLKKVSVTPNFFREHPEIRRADALFIVQDVLNPLVDDVISGSGKERLQRKRLQRERRRRRIEELKRKPKVLESPSSLDTSHVSRLSNSDESAYKRHQQELEEKRQKEEQDRLRQEKIREARLKKRKQEIDEMMRKANELKEQEALERKAKEEEQRRILEEKEKARRAKEAVEREEKRKLIEEHKRSTEEEKKRKELEELEMKKQEEARKRKSFQEVQKKQMERIQHIAEEEKKRREAAEKAAALVQVKAERALRGPLSTRQSGTSSVEDSPDVSQTNSSIVETIPALDKDVSISTDIIGEEALSIPLNDPQQSTPPTENAVGSHHVAQLTSSDGKVEDWNILRDSPAANEEDQVEDETAVDEAIES